MKSLTFWALYWLASVFLAAAIAEAYAPEGSWGILNLIAVLCMTASIFAR